MKKKEGEGQMAVSFFNYADDTIDKHIETINWQRSANLTVSEWESSPSGIDWQMIRVMRNKLSNLEEESRQLYLLEKLSEEKN